jgi:hypothetical protein
MRCRKMMIVCLSQYAVSSMKCIPTMVSERLASFPMHSTANE